MKIFVVPSANELGRLCAESVTEAIRAKNGDAVLGLATGSSPLETYQNIISIAKKSGMSFRSVKTVNLDEYCSLAPEHPQSFRYFMDKNLFSQLDLQPENIGFLNGLAEDAASECRRYDKLIEDLGGIDVQILGIGNNGHVGFNEPSKAFSEGTVKVTLTKDTIQANSRFFDDESQVPRYAYTVGMKAIFEAKKIVMIAKGEAKAEAVHEMLHGPITPMLPASLLQRHENTELYIDGVLADYLKKKYGEI